MGQYTTRLYCKEPGKDFWRLMNEIHSGSRFKNTAWPRTPDGMEVGSWHSTAEAQLVVAKDIRDGWRLNGNLPAGTQFRITQQEYNKEERIAV